MMIQKAVKLLLIITSVALCRKVSDFQPGLFRPSLEVGFEDVETGRQTTGEAMVFADLNGDRYTDYMAVPNRQEKAVYIYFWDKKLSEFIRNQFTVSKNDFSSIEEIMTADMNRDGRNEIIIVYKMPNATFELELYTISNCVLEPTISCQYQLWAVNVGVFNGMTNLPFLIDRTGEGQPEIFSISGDKRFISKLADNSTYSKAAFDTIVVNPDSSGSFNLVEKHFASIVDFDGNCEADLFMLSKKDNVFNLEFFFKTSTAKYQKQYPVPTYNKPIHFMTFLDLDANGAVDMVMITEDDSGKRKIMVSYNKHEAGGLCEKRLGIPFDFSQLEEIMILKEGITPVDTLHFGEVNNDGYPDLLAIFNDAGFKKPYLLVNSLQEYTGKRWFMENQYTKKISGSASPEQTLFFDFAEDGKLDILLMQNQTYEKDGTTTTKITRKSIINNLQEDTLFVKILPLSPKSSYDVNSNDISSAFGVSIEWIITLLDGSKKVRVLNQKSQVNYGALQLPFSLGGLGRTNNYIEDLTIGYEGDANINRWSPIIPNSQLMVYRQLDQWKLETLLTNSERVYQVIYSSIGILIGLLGVIIVLNYREAQEDRKNQYNVIQLIR